MGSDTGESEQARTATESETRKDETASANGQVSRRSFLSGLGAAAGLAATATPLIGAMPLPQAAGPEQTETSPDLVPVNLNVNGKPYSLQLEPRVALLDCLRENLKLPGTKKGCDHGQCGACTVHINGRRVLSCMSFAWMHSGDQITTIEGLGTPDHLHPMQAAFVEKDAYQCGYCTSGQIMSAVALLKEPCGPSDADVKQAMYGNLCRCGAYSNIVAAVQTVRQQGSPAQGVA